MKAGTAIVFASCVALVFFTFIAGCTGPGNGGPSPAGTPTAGPQPESGAHLADWGTDRNVYARNATATGWVNVTNTGSAPIDEIDFTVAIKRTVLFIPVEKTFSHNATGLDIRPGETENVQFSVVIPAEYSGLSTAGDYQYAVTASIAGREVGNYTKDITVA
ncbi:MAG TPA: hypothetical protein VGJ92_02330 [Methanocella sp.]|jgi:hypothetical protein